MTPLLSVLIPSYARAEFLRPLLARLAVEIDRAPPNAIEVVVSDNASEDHTGEVLERARARYPWLRTTRPEVHLLSAEENLHHGLQHCVGAYVWAVGDDDDISSGALESLCWRLSAPSAPAFMLFNLSTLRDETLEVRPRILEMHAQEVAWPVERIIASAGLMGLGACFTAVVAHRETLLKADWKSHLAWSPIYAHVISYLEAFADADCRLVDEAIATARIGATGIAEFARFADAAGHYVYWPWTVGLPHHLAGLIQRGSIGPDFPTRIVEPQAAGPFRLSPYIIRSALMQVERWCTAGEALHALRDADLDALTVMVAAGPRTERETVRQLCGWARLVASLRGVPGAPSAIASFQSLSREERRLLVAEVPADLGVLLTQGGRNAAPGRVDHTDPTLDVLLSDLGQSGADLRPRLFALVVANLRALSAGLEAGAPGPDLELTAKLTSGALGAFYVVYPKTRALSEWEQLDLRHVDPFGAPDILVAPDLGALEVQARILRDSTGEQFRFDERFGGWLLGQGRQGHCATPEGGDPTSELLWAVGDREALRRQVLRMRRALAPALRIASLAAAAADPVEEADLVKVRGALWFDAAWYLTKHRDARRLIELDVFEDAAHHWLALGGRYALSPSPWFDADAYLAREPAALEAIESGRFPSAVHHYLAEGARAGARPFEPFDPDYYLAANDDARAAFQRGLTPLEHALAVGLPERRIISPTFNEALYLAANPDVGNAVKAGVISSGLIHYVQHGRAEGRSLG